MTLRFPHYLLTIILFLVIDACGSAIVAQAQDERTPIVWTLSFEGNDTFSGTVLSNITAASRPNKLRKWFRAYSNFEFNETEMRRDRVRIERFYQRRGFSDVDVQLVVEDGNKPWKKKVRFLIREGSPIRIADSRIEIEAPADIADEIRANTDFQRTAESHDFLPGRRFQTVRKPDSEGAFRRVLQNMGFPWPEVEVTSQVDSLSLRATATIAVRPGPKSYFSTFDVQGHETVPERVVLREMVIKEGDLFSQEDIQDSQRQIFGHHLFRFATITLPEQPQDSTVHLQVRVRENPLRMVQASIGFGSEDLLRGQLSWQHRNINGSGNRLGFSGRGSFIEQRLGGDYLIPYVFNTRSSFVVAPFGQRRLEPAFELLRAGVSNSLIYQLRRNLTATASYEFTFNEESLRGESTALPDSVIGFNVSSLTFTGFYSQALSREPRGWVVQPSVELSGTFGESKFTFQKITLDVRRFQQVSTTTTLAARVNFGQIFFAQPDSLPANIRFFSGGTNSVRGFTRQQLGPKRPSFTDDDQFDGFVPIGGRATFTFNAEIRQAVPFFFDGFGIAAFLDGGQVWRALDRIDERALQFGTGGGLRYQSPIGPVRFDVGYKLNPRDEDMNIFQGEDFGGGSRLTFHFSIGQAF